MKKSTWTDTEIRSAVAKAKALGKATWIKDPGAERGKGTLELRASKEGRGRWYWRYTLQDRSSARIPLGVYGDKDGELTLREARLARDDKVLLYTKPESRDVRTFEAEQEQARNEAREHAIRAKQAKLEDASNRGKLSFDRLFAEYVEHLKAAGKTMSARDAGNMFANHVAVPFSAYAALPAADLSPGQIVDILRRLIDANKRTTARKLRSYLRAAFALAVGAVHDPNTKAQLDRFRITSNPVHLVKTIQGGSVAGERALNESELKAYIAWLEGHRKPHADMLLLALYLGGQRMSQLLRVRAAEVDSQEQTVVMQDSKGRRARPRKHVVPYGPRARQIIDELLTACRTEKREYLFVKDIGSVAGQVSATSKLVNAACIEITANAAANGLTDVKPFRMGDLRRTCETMLAPIVAKDIRAQLLSHGVSGVQATNYDRHTYLDEKRTAINTWERKLAEIAGGKKKAILQTKSKVAATRKRKAKRQSTQ